MARWEVLEELLQAELSPSGGGWEALGGTAADAVPPSPSEVLWEVPQMLVTARCGARPPLTILTPRFHAPSTSLAC